MTAQASRRAVLSAGAMSALAAIAAAATLSPAAAETGNDAELIALCSRFNELEHACDNTRIPGLTTIEQEHAAEALRLPWEAEQEELFERIMPMRATTLAGFRARAEMQLLWDKEIRRQGHDEGYWPDRMTWALLRDLAGGQDS